VTDPYTQARFDLSSSVGAQVVAGNTAWDAGNYVGAVQAYQLAGQQGAAIIGPEIDAVGYPNVTQNYTQQAWTLNSQLAAINATSAVQAEAILAQTLATKIQQLYEKAINAGYAAANSSPSSSSGLVIGLTLAAVGVLGGVIFGLHSIARKKDARSSRALTRRYSTAPTRRMSQAATRRA
jgi:hypothetical protein